MYQADTASYLTEMTDQQAMLLSLTNGSYFPFGGSPVALDTPQENAKSQAELHRNVALYLVPH